jgi:apolipoprotein N-acyltransferase
MNDSTARTTAARRAGWLLLGVALLLFSNGRWIFAPAAWLAPVGWLVFLERSRPTPGIVTAFVPFLLVEFAVWWGIIPVPGALYFVITGIYALVYFLPFAIHRLLAPRIAGLPSTFVFPLAWVSIEFVFQRWITPYGSWASLAYTQTDYPSLLQLASLTGVAGIAFLGAWFGSITAYILKPQQTTQARRWSAGIYALVLLAIVVFGQLRLTASEPAGELVRAAGLVGSPEITRELETLIAPARRGESLELSTFLSLGAVAAELNEDLFRRTRREARAGARIVAWSETAGRVMKADEPAFLERASRLAAEESIYLILAYGVWRPNTQPPLENKAVAIDAQGEVVWEYHKAHPVIGAESSFVDAGDGLIRRLETPYGAIGAVICHDLDHPALLRQARREGIGLIVGPSADWPLIGRLHANMARLRSIESGFSLLRPTSGGRSIATDTRGREVAAVHGSEDAMIAYVSAASIGTVYGAVGDLFAWLCLVGFVSLTVVAILKPRYR